MNEKKKKVAIIALSLDNLKIERILMISLIVCITILAAVQYLMTNPDIRVVLTQEENAEGVFFNKSDLLFNEGTIQIELTDSAVENAFVLINGVKAAKIKQGAANIKVKDGDLIEIDGTNSTEPFNVKIVSYSTNVTLAIDNSGIIVNKNIKTLSRVRIK